MKSHSRPARRTPSRQRTQPATTRFSGAVMTSFGGAGLWRRFVDKLGVEQHLAAVRVAHDGRLYTVLDYLMSLLFGALLGLLRQAHIGHLRQDPGALAALGLLAVPCQSSLSRFLDACTKFTAGRLLRVNDTLLRKVRRSQRVATIDLDGQVVSTRGNPEGANFGYNPKRRGAKSYFVLMSFLGEVRDILHAWTFPGTRATLSARMAIRAYQRARQALADGVRRLRLRADAAFFSHEFLCCLERDGVSYFIPARMNEALKVKVPGLAYQRVDDKYALAEFEYQAPGWPRPRRMVVVRERLDPAEAQRAQLRLFQHDGHSFQVIATNSTWLPIYVWHFYNHRCCLENIVKESQYDFGSNHVLCASFGGNVTWLALSVLAYNITNWLREKVLGQRAHRDTALTIRCKLIALPAKLVSSGRRKFLNLWRRHRSRSLYERAVAVIAALSF